MGLSNIPEIANGSVPLNGSVENLTQQALAQTADALFSSVFTRVVWAFVILLVGLVLGKIIEKITYRILSAFEINEATEKLFRIPIKLDALISGILGKASYIIAILLALNTLNLTGIALNTISTIVMILVIILVFLGLKDFVPNSFAGLILHAKRSFREGDYVCVDRVCGTVTEFGFLETVLKAKNGDIIHIPNVYFFSKKVKVENKQRKKSKLI